MLELKTPRVRFYSHACIAIEGEQGTLLTDPWFFGDVFHHSWTLLAPPDVDRVDFSRLRHIWISHAHPDHLHFPSLRLIRDRTSSPITVYYRQEENAGVRNALAKLGFHVVELEPHKETRIAEDITGTIFRTDYDSALVVRSGGRVILNLNDCTLTQAEIDSLRRMFTHVDVMFCQFSFASYTANANDPKGLQAARDSFLRKVERLFTAIRPAIVVPFASFFYFSKEENAYLNDWMVTLNDVVAALPHLPTQILYAEDVLLWQQWEARNQINLVRWRETMRAPKKIKVRACVDEAEILAAGEALARDVILRGLARYGPGEMHLEIRETGRAASIDFRGGRFAILQCPNPRRLVMRVPAEELLFFLKDPMGGEALHFSSCFQVADLGKWKLLRRFRYSLSPGGPNPHASRIRSYIRGLDRRYFGAIFSRSWARAGTRPLA